jgi:DNA-binding MarR family transcriptional regulator
MYRYRRAFVVSIAVTRRRLRREAMDPYDPAKDMFSDPRNSLGHLCRIAFRGFSRALEKRTIGDGVSSGQWRFLRVLWQEDALTQRELSRRVGMREPTTVIALRGLEKSGFVERRPSTTDKRKIHVHLTDHARLLRGRLAPAVAEVNHIATQGLTPEEIATLKRLLTQVGQNLAAENDGLATTEA